jgi:predicted enzyme related to lactoylglutathione lyase
VITGIAFTGYKVTDMQRARAFYEGVLGLTMSEELAGGKWVEYDVNGAILALTTMDPRWTPSDQGAAVAFEVDDLDAMVATLKEHGTKFHMEKSETPVCWIAMAFDPDGNKLVFHKLKAS